MSAKSNIEWTDATWNPTTGCTKVSPGCDHCYAERVTERFHGPGSFATVQLHPDRLDLPLRWRKPRKVFVNSMSDLFHPDVPDEFIARAFAVMAAAPQHTFQILTKRHARMRALLSDPLWWNYVTAYVTAYAVETGTPVGYVMPMPNVWLGVSVENQQWADIRIPALLKTPAAVRFLSCEPLLGPIELTYNRFCKPMGWGPPSPPHSFDLAKQTRWLLNTRAINWVIVGGESGPNARPMHPQWARDIRDQCVAAGVPFLFKQWGEWAPTSRVGVGVLDDPRECYGEVVQDEKYPNLEWRRIMRRVGKKAAGRELDGRTWDEYPAGAR